MNIPRPSDLTLISLLGALSVITPFSIDMYLPAFSHVAQDFHTSTATVSFSLSSYFIGLALGQIFYGPLLDRFGRKKPLYVGLAMFILASIACARTQNIETLVVLRFVQAMGGCVAQVASVAMVRDFFPVEESAKIFSLLFLFIGVSPLLAPSVGGLIMMAVSWRAVFLVLAVIVLIFMVLIYFFLPEGHTPDPTISLKPKPILLEFLVILRHPQFCTYAMTGAFSFAGLFAYVAGSPIIFMEGFHLSAQAYSGIFAMLTTGFILGSQVNVALLRKFSSEIIFTRTMLVQMATGLIFVAGSYSGILGFYGTLVLFFAFLLCAGITYPNAAALALMPFMKNAGSASALLGFLQLGTGAVISTCIGIFASHESFPVIAVLGSTAFIGYMILLFGRAKIAAYVSDHHSVVDTL